MTRLVPDTWVLVADGEKALFLKNRGDGDYPVLDVVRKEEQDNPPDAAQGTDKPGRFNDGPSVQRSAVDDTDWHQLAKDRFAVDLSDRLYKLAHAGRFDHLVVAASPQTLGVLRKHFHKEVEACVIGEIPKDLTNHPIDEIEAIVKSELAEQ